MKNLYKILFEGENIEDEELIRFKDEWYPTNEDWHTMIMNMNNHAPLHSIFNKISDIDKVVRCYIAANMIGYPKLKDYEYNLFHGKKWKNWLLWDEIELIQNENVPIPEEYQELINDLTEYDITGGVALRNQDLGELVQFKTIFDAIATYLKFYQSKNEEKIVFKLKDEKFRCSPWCYTSYSYRKRTYCNNRRQRFCIAFFGRPFRS